MVSKDWIKGLYRDNFENVISKSKEKKWKYNISKQMKIRIKGQEMNESIYMWTMQMHVHV